MRRSNSALSIALILIGSLLLISRYIFDIEVLDFDSGDFWPLIILVIGLTFEMSYFVTGKKSGLLVPGGILTTLGFLFFFEVGTNWSFSEYTWPIYIFAAAIGLFQLYLFGGRKKGLLIPIFILTAVGSVSFLSMFLNMFFSAVDIGFVVPVVLILAGIGVMFRKKRNTTW